MIIWLFIVCMHPYMSAYILVFFLPFGTPPGVMRNVLCENRLVSFCLFVFKSTETSWPFHFMSCFTSTLPFYFGYPLGGLVFFSCCVMMRIFPPRCMPGSSCSHPEGVGALQVVPHCPTAEMWRTTVGECRLLFASCSKSGKSDVTFFVHSCLIWYICIYIYTYFHSVLIYALCLWLYSSLSIENPENATWALRFFLASTSKANDTS